MIRTPLNSSVTRQKSFRNIRYYSSQTEVSRKYDKNDAIQFKSMFKQFASDLLEDVRKYDTTFAPSWFERSLQYNVNGGKLNRGQMTVIAYKILADDSQLTVENIELARKIGWVSELFEAALFMVDDIIDGSEIRRNMPCWHTLSDVKMQSINDMLMLENGTFVALRRYIGHKNYYPRIFQMFSEALFVTSLGQTLDTLITRENVINQTMERFQGIVQYKTCHSAFYLPVAFALEMCGYKHPGIYEDAKKVLVAIGLFFQARNDYLDCFGELTETGKEGTDIQENKVSWMAITALNKVNEKQKEIMQSCYGQKDPSKVAKVISLYKELGIDKDFLEYEKESYERINNMIQGSTFYNLKPLLQMIWDTIYHKKIW
ncbi:unnamed protein product [Hermetia illucens]|uniref:Farnesyl pyrophosphate synthase n=1 Tax=Hermetia illucens TaxID=343691 RepID=A0A7R8YL91_HERIL|nr:unnamed protein product [Hermetia illucens]